MAEPLWHGRFGGGPAEVLWAYTLSLPYDRRLAPFDILGSTEHAEGLRLAGVLTDEEAATVRSALEIVAGEMERGSFAYEPTDEDIHTAIERRVTELAGPAGAKLHTGRSRNDQVATATRLFTKEAILETAEALLGLQQVLLQRAQAAGETYLPGLTHLQHAQPVLLAHHLLAHLWAIARDIDRLGDCYARLDVSPLGAGALAGSSLPLDPAATAHRLGFDRAFDNSLDAVSDRDFVAEALFVLALIGVHLSRLGEELVLWSSTEFGYITLDDAYATGSSMLPQKKNPDIAELARGKTGRLVGNLTGFLVTLKGLPLAYNRDLQEDKEPLFDSFDQVRLGVAAIAGMIETMTIDDDRMCDAADSPYAAATDLAEFMVRAGVPFREAHAVIGDLVRRALGGESSLERLVTEDPRLGPAATGLLEPGVSVSQRTTPGGAGPEPVAVQLRDAIAHLDRVRAGVSALRVPGST